MLKQEMEEREIAAPETDEAIEKSIVAFLAQFDGEHAAQPDTEKAITAEQQRIWSLESEICRLRVDMEIWKKTSLCLAHELQELLIYQPATLGQPGQLGHGAHAAQARMGKVVAAHQTAQRPVPCHQSHKKQHFEQ